MWVGINGLQVGNVNDGKQADDGEADGDNVLNAREAQGNEKRQSGLRTISGRAEGVEAKDGNTRDGTNVLGTFFTGCERLTDDEVEERHESSIGRLCHYGQHTG